MVAVEEIKKRLSALLDGSLSIEDFEDWIVAGSWNMHTWSDKATQTLVGAIEVRLAEFHQDHLSDSELREELLDVLDSSGVNTYQKRIDFDGDVAIEYHLPRICATRTEGSSETYQEPFAKFALPSQNRPYIALSRGMPTRS